MKKRVYATSDVSEPAKRARKDVGDVETKAMTPAKPRVTPVKQATEGKEEIREDGDEAKDGDYVLQLNTDGTYQRVSMKPAKKALRIQEALGILQKAVGGYIETVPATTAADTSRWTMYGDEEGAMKNRAGTNDLAAYVMRVLGFNHTCYARVGGVFGPFVVCSGNEKMPGLPVGDLHILEVLCDELATEKEDADEEGDEDSEAFMKPFLEAYRHLRKQPVVAKKKVARTKIATTTTRRLTRRTGQL